MPAMVTVKLRWGAVSLSVFTVSSCPSGALFAAIVLTDQLLIRGLDQGCPGFEERQSLPDMMVPVGSCKYVYILPRPIDSLLRWRV